MSGNELAKVVAQGGAHRIDASSFSVGDLVRAAQAAFSCGGRLILFNHAKLERADLCRILDAGNRGVIFDDVRMI